MVKEQEKKMEEQEKKMEEQEKKMEEQDKVVEELKKVLKEEQDQKLKEQEEMEKKFSHKFQELQKMFKELRVTSDQNEAKHNDLTRKLQIQQRTFEITIAQKSRGGGQVQPCAHTQVATSSVHECRSAYEEIFVWTYSLCLGSLTVCYNSRSKESFQWN